ncbi:YbaB/EbfC family nucleoid-associated protein [Rhodococcus sp. P1Y]|uniref:YbaB/EbfC family nucleoid-associated protein n=1 Tax=Rhodococcus sp. P1Y TaxID=1302308 RepID=UPI0013795B51|nr:YbaB/EbfC family nucleoid-associated protein [Rhodococcus sp. P1Y]
MTAGREEEELTAKAARIHRALQTIRGIARSGGGEVRIEVDVDGRITDLVLSESFSAISADVIVQTHASALDEATRAAGDIKRELLEDPRVSALVDRTTAARPTYPTTDLRQPPSIYDRW